MKSDPPGSHQKLVYHYCVGPNMAPVEFPLQKIIFLSVVCKPNSATIIVIVHHPKRTFDFDSIAGRKICIRPPE